jgi:hypothetical protein
MKKGPKNAKKSQTATFFSLRYCVLMIIVLFILVQLWMTSNAKPNVSDNGESIPIIKETPTKIIHTIAKPTPKPTPKPIANEPADVAVPAAVPDDDSLPKNLTLLSNQPFLTLPSISFDQSELILSSLIERTSNSWSLHLTTFFLSRAMVDPNEIRSNKVDKVQISSIPSWEQVNQKQRQIYYLANGRRALHRYDCRIQMSSKESTWTTTSPGIFLPNRQTTDSNTNRRIDILRCPLQRSHRAYLNHAGSVEDSLLMEILRNDEVIARIAIPWQTRRTGYLLSSPPQASQFNAWKGFDDKAALTTAQHTRPKPSSPESPGDEIYLCTSGHHATTPSSQVFHLLEFVQHHLMMKVSHMFISERTSWSSKNMNKIITALSRFITSGHVSIVSESSENNFNIPSTAGLWWTSIPLLNIHLNACLFLSKGTADYIGVWDINELFIPRLPYNNLIEVINSANPPPGVELAPSNITQNIIASQWKGGPGWADGDGHPYCYLALYSVQISPHSIESLPGSLGQFNGNPWSSARYGPPPLLPPPEPAKSILPTKNIFQAGPILSGACQLDWKWTHCGQKEHSQTGIRRASEELCFVDTPSSDYIHSQYNKNPPSFPATQDVDSVVLERDTKQLDMDTQGLLYQFTPQVVQVKDGESGGDVSRNAYIRRFATGVESVLESYFSREELFSFYLHEEENQQTSAVGDWVPYPTAFPPTLQESSLPQQNSGDIKSGSSNGYLDFKEPFTRPDVLENPPPDSLPAFASDYSEVLLSSLIERKHSSWDLHLTSFLMSHSLVSDPPKGYGMRRLSKVNDRKWKFIFRKFFQTKYFPSGVRDNEIAQIKCRLRNSPDQEPYEVNGVFMPNALTPDGNANRRVDILRCPIQHPRWCYRHLADTNISIMVEILKSNQTIFKFSVPWKTRRTGYLLDAPDTAFTFDPWKGFDPSSPKHIKPGDVGGDELYMAVPGIESPFTQKNLPMYAEFMEHHYLLGVQHMFWAVTYAWNGLNMANFISTFKPFFDDKRLTVSSQAGDNIDLLYSYLGASLDRDNIKIMHVNMYLYLTKGVVDYLAIWDIDEYFIPRLPYNNILEVIHAAESPAPLKPYQLTKAGAETTAGGILQLSQEWKGGRGWADGDAHPFCYIMIFSEVIYGASTDYDPEKPWVGERLRHLPEKSGLAFKKSIVPTRRIFQVGLHMHGACSLEPDFRSPNCPPDVEFCYARNEMESRGYSVTPKQAILPFSPYHHFDASVYDRDAKALNIKTEATIYHFQIHRSHLTASVETLKNSSSLNEYVLRFYPKVLESLQKKGYEVLINLPEKSVAMNNKIQIEEGTWMRLPSLEKYVLGADSETLRAELPIHSLESEDHRHGSHLPYFLHDFTELLMSAIIERDADSFSLFLALFFLSREQLANKSKRIKNISVRPNAAGVWSRAIHHTLQTVDQYTEYGTRHDGHEYICRLKNSYGMEVYSVKGVWVPNQLTPDANANKRVDILRCPIANPQHAYQHLAHSDESLDVEIFRDTEKIVKFSVPWKTRKTGYMLTTPPNITTSRLDLWKGSKFSKPQAESQQGSSVMDELHMCVPGIESMITKTTIAIYSEFFEHHYLLGVNHIHAAVTHTWSGSNMKLFLGLFQKKIEQGLMSVTSTAGDLDGKYGLFGMNMQRDNVKVFNVNTCLYLVKGVADYVAIWDIDEYFIPKPPHHTIMDVIRGAESPTPLQPFSPIENPFEIFETWKGGRGWADADGHPLCYLMLSSKVVNRISTTAAEPTITTPWIGDRFTQGPEVKSPYMFKKPIIPTRKIFQAALHMVGGCKLDPPWNGCDPPVTTSLNSSSFVSSDNFCYITSPKHRYGLTINQTNKALIDFSLEQRFDGLILDKDAKKIDMDTEALIYHFQVNRGFLTSSSHADSTNDYVAHWSGRVRKELQKNGFELFVRLPKHVPGAPKPDETFKWPEIRTQYEKVIAGMKRGG